MSGSWHPRPIGDEIREQVARFGRDAAIGPLVQAWPGAVGEAIAANAWPARIARDGTLHVATSSSVWAFELTALAETVLEHLHAALGDSAPPKIVFAPGRLPERGPLPEEVETPPRRPSPRSTEPRLRRSPRGSKTRRSEAPSRRPRRPAWRGRTTRRTTGRSDTLPRVQK